MSTLENTALTELNRIPLGQRISELLSEKGEAFSIRAFAIRIGMNRETLRLTLSGARPISTSLLQQIADGLSISVERLKQMDTVRQDQELSNLLHAKKRTKPMMIKALSLATELVEVARGASERGFSLNNLGRVQYLQQMYDEAHESFLRALVYAKNINDVYADSKLLYLVTANLMLTYIIRKDFSNIEEMLELVEQAFSDNPRAMGLTHYTRMKMHEARDNLERAKKHAYLSLEYYDQTYDNKQIGIAMVNVAHFEFVLGNYFESEKLLALAIEMLEPYEYYKVFAVNEYAKTQIKLKNYSSASNNIANNMELAKEYGDIYNELLVTYSVAEGNPVFAQRVSDNSNASVEVRSLACKCLIDYYSSIDDAQSVLKYYKKGQLFSDRKNHFFDWEGKD